MQSQKIVFTSPSCVSFLSSPSFLMTFTDVPCSCFTLMSRCWKKYTAGKEGLANRDFCRVVLAFHYCGWYLLKGIVSFGERCKCVYELSTPFLGGKKTATSNLNLVANHAWQFTKWLQCVCVCERVIWRKCTWGKWDAKDEKTRREVVIHHGYGPSFWNCNFPSFCSMERSLCADSRPVIMSRIHTNCFPFFVGLLLRSRSFWLRLCSEFLYDCRCGQRWAIFHAWGLAERG